MIYVMFNVINYAIRQKKPGSSPEPLPGNPNLNMKKTYTTKITYFDEI